MARMRRVVVLLLPAGAALAGPKTNLPPDCVIVNHSEDKQTAILGRRESFVWRYAEKGN